MTGGHTVTESTAKRFVHPGPVAKWASRSQFRAAFFWWGFRSEALEREALNAPVPPSTLQLFATYVPCKSVNEQLRPKSACSFQSDNPRDLSSAQVQSRIPGTVTLSAFYNSCASSSFAYGSRPMVTVCLLGTRCLVFCFKPHIEPCSISNRSGGWQGSSTGELPCVRATSVSDARPQGVDTPCALAWHLSFRIFIYDPLLRPMALREVGFDR